MADAVPDPLAEGPASSVGFLVRHPLLAGLPGGSLIGGRAWAADAPWVVAVGAGIGMVGLQWAMWGPSGVGMRLRPAILRRDARKAAAQAKADAADATDAGGGAVGYGET